MKLKQFKVPTAWGLPTRVPTVHFAYGGMMVKIETRVEFDMDRSVFPMQTVHVALDGVNYFELDLDACLPYQVDRDTLIAAGIASFFSIDGVADADYYRLLQNALDSLTGGRHIDDRNDSAEWWAADDDLDIIWVHSPMYAEYALAMGLNELENSGPNPWPKKMPAYWQAFGYASSFEVACNPWLHRYDGPE